MTASTRRAALGAILAAPLASAPAVALTGNASSDVPDHEARFLALVPRLRALVPPLERAKAYMSTLYALGDRQAGDHPGWGDWKVASAWADRATAARKRNGYSEAWDAVNRHSAKIDELVSEFMDQRMTTLSAIAWKARLADALDCWEDEAGSDLAAWAREDEACA